MYITFQNPGCVTMKVYNVLSLQDKGSALTEKCTNMPTTANIAVHYVVSVVYILQGKCTRSVQTEKCTNMQTTVNIHVHFVVGSDRRSAIKEHSTKHLNVNAFFIMNYFHRRFAKGSQV